MKIIKFPNRVQDDVSDNELLQTPMNTNEPNQLDLYSQLSNCHDSDNITMIIGGNTYTASKLQMMSVISYYIGLMKMREMSLMPGFGEMPHPPVNPPHVNNPNMNNGIVPPPPCPKDDGRK